MIELNEEEERMLGKVDERTAHFYERHADGILEELEKIEDVNRTKIFLSITSYAGFLLENTDVEILADIYNRHFEELAWQNLTVDA